MITLLSTLLGFLGSAFPEILQMMKDKSSRSHELAMMEKQAELGLKQAQEQRASAEVTAQAQEMQALLDSYKNDIAVQGKGFVSALSASVRPFITYAFFALYAAVKVAQYHLFIDPSLPWQQSMSSQAAIVALWGEEDMALFSAILAFWFGTRQIKRATR